MPPTAFVGLSGGVDSSVAALRLIRAGYNVVGVFIETWYPDFIRCDAEAERLDAMRVAAALNIPFLICDAKQAYKQGVADYMIREYTAGRTPNPDVMCNRAVKFGVFLDFARDRGADFIATGHYAQIEKTNAGHTLRRGADTNKDQSYFLWTLTNEQLMQVKFPVGDSQKADIREEARKAGLPTYKKADSQGICFLGQIDMKEFLAHYISEKVGQVVDERGAVIGEHSGAFFYTLGQRHGFQVIQTNETTKPHYIVGKDIEKNKLIVSTAPPSIEAGTIKLTQTNHIAATSWKDRALSAQVRYRQKPFAVTVVSDAKGEAELNVVEKTETPSAGQSCVLYEGEYCLGGGVIV